MKNLIELADILIALYSKLDKLISMSCVKSEKAAKEFIELNKQADFQDTDDYPETEYHLDMAAYSDSINRRFDFLFTLTCQFLKLYLKQIHAITPNSLQETFDILLKLRLISKLEAHHLIRMMDFVESVRNPDMEGNYLFAEEMLLYSVVLNQVALKLHPSIKPVRAKPNNKFNFPKT